QAELFGDQLTPKQLTTAVAGDLIEGSRGFAFFCDSVDLSEPHTVGAIIAHTMMRIIAILAPSAEEGLSQATIDARYRYSVAWIKAMVAAEKNDSARKLTSKNLFAPLGPAIESLAAGATAAQKTRICELSLDLLPA